MHQILLFLHGLNRWLVLLSLCYAIYCAFKGYFQSLAFSAHHNLVRHLTATIAHIQLLLGLSLYMISPVVKYNAGFTDPNLLVSEQFFFRYIHILLMAVAVVLLTIGSARAKRAATAKQKFATMLLWFSIALLVIIIAIPWPFSPLAARPFLRTF